MILLLKLKSIANMIKHYFLHYIIENLYNYLLFLRLFKAFRNSLNGSFVSRGPKYNSKHTFYVIDINDNNRVIYIFFNVYSYILLFTWQRVTNVQR